MCKKLAILIVLIILIGTNKINAEPFDSSTITLNLVSNINNNDFHNFWEPKTGFEINGRTNFYVGILELGYIYNKNKSLSIDRPDYNSIYSFVGFGFEYHITKSLSNYSSFRVGNYYMDFDDPNIHSELKSEHELGLGFVTSVQYSLNNNNNHSIYYYIHFFLQN